MKVVLPIDPFNLTQEFGVNPDAYKKFGLAGHNGWDVRTIYPDTPAGRRFILATQKSQFYKQAFDGPGYGLYFEVITKAKNTWKHTFAHCNSIETFTEKEQGETMAISDSTGNITGPHLHWTAKKIRIVNGAHEVINYNNGYFGAVNPQEYLDEVRSYTGSEPMPTTDVTVGKEQYEKLVTNARIKEQIAIYLSIVNPDIAAYDDFVRVIAGFKSRITDLQTQLNLANAEVFNRTEQVSRLKEEVLKSEELRGELTDQLNEAIKKVSGIQTIYEDRLGVMQGQIDQMGKEKGELHKQLLECKNQSPVEDLTIGQVLVLLFNKIKDIRLK